MDFGISVIGYLAPDTVVPAASALVAALGVLMIFAGRIFAGVKKLFRFCFRRGE